MDRHDLYLVGVDMGSTGIKVAALMDGQVAASAQTGMTYRQDGPVCEYDADAYYQTVAALIRRITAAMPPDARCGGIAAACASGNTLLLKQGQPLMPVISWRDNRGAEEMELVFGPLTEEQVHRRVGWHKVPKFPLAQLSWLKCHRPELLRQADMICEGSCYVNYRLCGNFAMDHSTATTFYLLDQEALRWDKSTLEALDIPVSKLPRLTGSGVKLGGITQAASEETGLPAGTPVVSGCYDGAAAARSVGLLREDELLLSCGTSWVSIYPRKSRQELLDLGVMIDPYRVSEGLWLGMTSLGECSLYVDRALDTVLPQNQNRAAEFNRLALSSVPGSHGLLLNPMRLEPGGSGSENSPSDVCRAVMEGVAYSVKRQMRALLKGREDKLPSKIMMVGGPSRSPLWPQIVSDIFGLPVQVMFGSNACSVGAAMLAGLGSGVFRSFQEAQSVIRKNVRTYRPDPQSARAYQDGFGAFQEKFPGLEANMH